MKRSRNIVLWSIGSLMGIVALVFGFTRVAGWSLDEPAPAPTDVSEAVFANNVGYVAEWLKKGGNPNYIGHNSESLLYTATGPHGGSEVLILLLNAGANPNLGMGTYTPLMNAASWCDSKGVRLLLQHGGDPNLRNHEGQTALDMVGQAGGTEREVIDILTPLTKANRGS